MRRPIKLKSHLVGGFAYDRWRVEEGFNVGWFWDDVYLVNYNLLWPCPDEKRIKWIRRNLRPDYADDGHRGGATCLFFPAKGKNQIVISLEKWDNSTRWITNLVHETLHAMQFVFEHRGMPLNDATSEAQAYYQGCIFRRCLLLLRDK